MPDLTVEDLVERLDQIQATQEALQEILEDVRERLHELQLPFGDGFEYDS